MSDNIRMTFDHFAITAISFNLNRDFHSEKDVTVSPEIEGRADYEKETRKLRAFMKVSLNSGNLPFYLTVEGVGVLTFDGDPDQKTLNNISSINAPAIIFPYIRETVADITRRAGFPPLHLPPVNFVNIAKKAAPADIHSGKNIAKISATVGKAKASKKTLKNNVWRTFTHKATKNS
ncbi:MAG: protein-export chaperone SecB [Nitrospinae bacterium]|nr:protein-export chaperone SecB [Nitrospinota bacterium]MBI3815284.1 protein-export chaperone SecB [Nitrospinota bacterium]